MRIDIETLKNKINDLHISKTCHTEDKAAGARYLVHYNGERIFSLRTAWKNAKARAMITRRIRLYDIRHAFATQLLASGANLKAVSEILGHASPDMTMKVYQHVSDDLKRQAVDMMISGNGRPITRKNEKDSDRA